MQRLHRLVTAGLDRTRALWPDIRRAYGWVHAAARILKNDAGLEAEAVARRLLTVKKPDFRAAAD